MGVSNGLAHRAVLCCHLRLATRWNVQEGFARLP